MLLETGLVGLVPQAILLHLHLEALAADGEAPGGPGDVAVLGLEHALDPGARQLGGVHPDVLLEAQLLDVGVGGCGAGGARMFMEEEGPRVNVNRTEEILDANVDTVAVGCPFCSIMLTDGMKAKNVEEDVKVLDLAEIVADSLPDVSISALRARPTEPTTSAPE